MNTKTDAGIEELDRELAIGYRGGLADEVLQPLLARGPMALLVHVGSVSGAGRPPIDEHAESGGGRSRRRTP